MKLCHLSIFSLLILLILPGGWVRADIDSTQLQKDVETLTKCPSRVVGTPGYEQAVEYLKSQIKSLPNVEFQDHVYDVMVPSNTSAKLIFADGKETDVYPLWPAGIRLNSTPLSGISGNLVYCKKGALPDLLPSQIKGNIAVIEATSTEDWRQPMYFGATAIILLGSPDLTNEHLRVHDIPIPVNFPRFYIPDGVVANALRKQVVGQATLKASLNWKRAKAHNLYALVKPGADALIPPNTKNGSPGKAYGVMAITVPIDSTGLVMDNAPGASQAVQTAAALGYLRQIAKEPLKRPVLVVFTGADGFNLLGSRNMFMALGEPPGKWQDEIDEQKSLLDESTDDATRLKALNGDPTQLDITRDRRIIDRIVKIIETDVSTEQDELFRLRLLPSTQQSDSTNKRAKELEARQVTLSSVRYAFMSEPKSLPQYGDMGIAFLKRALARVGGEASTGTEGLVQQHTNRLDELTRRQELFRWLAKSIGRNEDPDVRSNADRLIEIMIGLDFSDRGVRCGPVYWGQFARQVLVTQILDYKEWFPKLLANNDHAMTEWFKPISTFIDFDSLGQTRTQQTFLAAPIALPTEMGIPWGTPAFTFATLEDQRPLRDTPNDTLANLNLNKLLPQVQAVYTLLVHAWNDPTFIGPPEIRHNTNQFEGQVVSSASGRPIPDLPREGFLATYYYVVGVRKIPQLMPYYYAVGMRRTEVRDCDSEGRYYFDGLPRNATAQYNNAVKVYQTAPDSGAIVASSDLGKQAGDIQLVVSINSDVNPIRSLVFNCEEFSMMGLYDPRFLQSLGEVQMMDARRNADPQQFDAVMYNQMIAAQLEPGSRAYLLFRYGRVGNRLVLLNVPEAGTIKGDKTSGVRGEGEGYTISELNRLSPIGLVTARDFWRLNQSRIEEYRKAGVSSTLIDSMHKNARLQIEAAEKALKTDDAPSVMKNATGAWADEARVYDAVLAMANDTIRAAIFLLLLAVPFSFCMERLCVGTPSVYKQIAWAAAIFGLMAAALWLFHPAFKISNSPLIIILAFAIILMSVIVIGVVYSKFDTELKRIRSGRGTGASTSFANASVLMTAIMLGIANMRRRKFRTFLTSVTIVLITFAVLCFTSTTRYQGLISLPTGVDASHSGVLLRQRGFRPMPPESVKTVRTVYQDKEFVECWWTLSASETKEMINLSSGGDKPFRVIPMQAMLGLTPGEGNLSHIKDIVPNFDRMEKGETNIIYLSISTAEQLGVRQGDTVRIAGMDLQVAGLYDANQFDQRIEMLSGESLSPLKYQSGMLDSTGKRMDATSVDTLDLDAGASSAEASQTYEHLPSNQFGIISAVISKRLDGSTLRSVGVKLSGDTEVKSMVEDLTKRFALATFAGYSDGVKLVSASNLSSIGGGSEVAIPLAIGGLIIFNTMMGSIAERKREIHVYTSLGLAPIHVGALFLAEALTYGLIGSVFGYIIGQGVGTLMMQMGWLGNVTLNYSGTSAMLTMSLILLIVLLSALVPARLASKLAAPSIERSWKVPLPKDNTILANLPFTINKTAAQGVVGYLAEYFEAHQEGSIGKFSAGKIEAFTGTGADEKQTRGLKTVIWLTPFDLGVRQHLMLLIHPGEFPDIYEVQVMLERLSGDDGSWYRMNRSFLTELRKQFLQWRSLSPQRMKQYVEESRKLFAEVPEEVVTIEPGEGVRLG